MLTFAYGSSMDWEQTRGRCPSARFLCIAKLEDHRLVFPRMSETRGCGVAGVEPKQNSDVWGVVFQIEEVDVGKLDKCEGYKPGRAKNSYVREERHVYVDGKDEEPLSVWMYVAQLDTLHPPALPNAAYMELIVGGAQFWHLPTEYITMLEQIKTKG
ncbi:MAG: gamma-glutamylcyclotransferase family protein [Dehalococcoidia bacterium]|nr:gamma-glutamylcyclotransferase family protein [Dehalococcoidia bacterium]